MHYLICKVNRAINNINLKLCKENEENVQLKQLKLL